MPDIIRKSDLTATAAPQRSSLGWLATTSIVGLLLVGVPYFRTPYSETDFTSLIGAGLFVVGVLTALSVWLGEAQPIAAFLVALGVPLNVVIARVFVDVATDPTSHNLWPLEIVLAGILGAVVAAVGVGVGLLGRRISRGRQRP